jgi:hypothetical protein
MGYKLLIYKGESRKKVAAKFLPWFQGPRGGIFAVEINHEMVSGVL